MHLKGIACFYQLNLGVIQYLDICTRDVTTLERGDEIIAFAPIARR
jgi:hypothetical protein